MELVINSLLILTSLVAVTFIIERGLALRWNKVVPRALEDAVEKFSADSDPEKFRRACEASASPCSNLLITAVKHLDWPKAENEDAVQTRARNEIVRLERGLVVLEIAVGIAPLLGLVGTIYGMITLFSNLGQSGMSDNAQLAKGIGLILYTTLGGLLIAIPSLVFWSYYTRKVEALAVEMETLCGEFLRRAYRGK